MSLDHFWENPSTPVIDEYAPNPNTPPKLQRFTAKRLGLSVSGVIASKEKPLHSIMVFIWYHDADGFAICKAVEKDSLTDFKPLDD